jgi:hypothetical protein
MATSGKSFLAIQVERVDGHCVDFDYFRSEFNNVLFVAYIIQNAAHLLMRFSRETNNGSFQIDGDEVIEPLMLVTLINDNSCLNI